jgi:hypothetical protein
MGPYMGPWAHMGRFRIPFMGPYTGPILGPYGPILGPYMAAHSVAISGPYMLGAARGSASKDSIKSELACGSRFRIFSMVVLFCSNPNPSTFFKTSPIDFLEI